MDASTLGIIDETEAPEFDRADQPEEPVASQVPEEKPEVAAEEAPAAEVKESPEASVESSLFRFLGKEWESQAKAEEVLGSQEGRISKLNETVRDYEKRLNDYWDYIQAVSKENETLRTGKSSEPKAEEKTEAKSKDDDEDWFKGVQLAMDLAKQRGHDPVQVALYAMNERFEKRLGTMLEERISKAVEPLTRMEEDNAVTTAQRNLFLWAQEQGNYPELAKGSVDEGFVKDLYSVFGQLAAQYPPQFAYSGAGFDYAYRLTKDYRGQAAPSAPAPTPPVGRDEKGRFTSNGAARAASDISGSPPSIDKPNSDPVQERLKELGRHQPITNGSTSLGFYE